MIEDKYRSGVFTWKCEGEPLVELLNRQDFMWWLEKEEVALYDYWKEEEKKLTLRS